MIGIYSIKNLINGKVYIGSSINITKRWNLHVKQLIENKHHSIKLQRSWNKYGKDSFVFEIIEETLKVDLLIKEQYWLDKLKTYKNGYNCNPTAGSNLGRKWSNATKKKMSKRMMGNKINLGRKFPNKKLDVNGDKNPFYGKSHTNETKAKISKAKIGKVGSNKGMVWSDETKEKIRQSKIGKKLINGKFI